MSDLLLSLVTIAQLALSRHAEALAQKPKRGATAYLRAALTAARQMARLHKSHPELLTAALDIAAQVLRAAQDAEARVFAAGGNSAPYLTLLATAEALRLTLHDAAPSQAEVATPVPTQPATPTPLPAHPSAAPTRPEPPAPQVAAHAAPAKQTARLAPPPKRRPPHYRKASGAKLQRPS